MDQENTDKKSKKIVSGTHMSRKDIVDAVTEPESVVVLEKRDMKNIVIPTGSFIKPDIEKLIKEMEVPEGSLMNVVVRVFCQEKNASAINAKVLIMRIRNLNDEQLKVVRVLCMKPNFTATNILKAIQSIRRYDGTALLTLRAFIDLEGIGPGPLNQFFNNTLPQSNPNEVGKEAYEDEIREKMMRPEQHNAFYNICYQIKEINTTEAIDILRRTRKLKLQHAELINSFLKKGAIFGEKPIAKTNILNLVKLLLVLPELASRNRFQKLVKRISRKKDKRMDFQYIVQTYKDELVKEKSGGGFIVFLRRLFG
ncbi:MAG: hypothetical protein MI892_08250 [Desulfobacterales bacterium]|nr:hypothetical protein [Desulfobacterales bacterium]